MNSVALYLRKSRDEENESRDVTLARHEKLLREYCERNDLIIKKIYKEIVSGESISARFEMQRLLIDVKAGMFDAVCVIELERLSRGNQADQAEILEIFKKTGTKIHTLTKVYDLASDNEIDEEFFEFGLFMSRREYKVINRRLMRGRTASLCEGYYTGSVTPYGFSKKRMERGFVLIPHESEAEIVKMIFNMYISGETHAGIALHLNSLGIKQRNGKAWQPQRMRELLRNKTYIGLLHVKNPRIDATWIQGKHEPLIDEEIFHTVQQIAQKKRSDYFQNLGRYDTEGTSRNILRGLIFCADCKRPLVRYKTANSSNLYYTYICQSHTDNPAACPKKYLHENQLKEMLWSTLKTELLLASGVETLASYYLTIPEVIDQRYAYESEIIAQKKVLSRTEMLYDSLFQNYADKLMTEQEYIEMRQQYRNDIEQAKIRLKELEAKYQEDRSIIAENPWLSACRPFYGISELTEDLAHTLIERVDVDSNNCISVVLRYQDKYNALLQILETDKSEVWI